MTDIEKQVVRFIREQAGDELILTMIFNKLLSERKRKISGPGLMKVSHEKPYTRCVRVLQGFLASGQIHLARDVRKALFEASSDGSAHAMARYLLGVKSFRRQSTWYTFIPKTAVAHWLTVGK